nr:glycosyltransferase family 87 protein [uncultured Sphingomonas sp.]
MVRVTWLHAVTPSAIDFLFFWDSARLVVEGNAAQVYSGRNTSLGYLEPLGYPPPFLLLIWPLGLTGYGPALILWLAVTGAIFWLSSRQALAHVLTNPGAALNVHFGQSSFVTGAFFLGGLFSLATPAVAGLLIGGLAIKPHLALLVPLALVAGGHWRVLAYAGLSAGLLVAAAAIAFGPGIYIAWWVSLSQYRDWLVSGYWPWSIVSSVYGMLRWSGLPFVPAMGVHLLVAATAALLVWRAWREQWACKVEVAAAATLLASPYLFTYDSILLVAPIGWLWARDRWASLAIIGIAMLPLAAVSFLGVARWIPAIVELPSSVPVASALALAMLVRNERSRQRPEQGLESTSRLEPGISGPLSRG